MANSTLQLGVQVDVTSANTDLQGIIDRLKKLEDATVRVSAAQGHGVSQMQAAAAAIRVGEGNLTNNVRAAERFLGLLPGVGAVLQAAFPVVGALALSGVLYEMGARVEKLIAWFKKVEDAPGRIKASFDIINGPLKVANDELEVTNARLANEIAKLSGRPQDGLRLALAEAIEFSDKLAESLNTVTKEIAKIFKEESIGSFKSLFANMAPTDGLVEEWRKFTEGLSNITLESERRASKLSDPAQRAAIFAQATTQRIAAIDQEISAKERQIEAEKRLQVIHDHPPKEDPGIFAVPNQRASNLAGVDQSQLITENSKALEVLYQARRNAALRVEETQLTKVLEPLKANKDAMNAQREVEKDAAQDLRKSLENELTGMGKIAEVFVQKIKEMHDKGVASFKAFSDYMHAMQNDMATEQKKEMAKIVEANEKGLITGREEQGKVMTGRLDYQTEVIQRQQEAANKGLTLQEQAIGESRDMQIKSLDALDARTVQQKLWVEQRKLQIEEDYLGKSLAMHEARINVDAQAQLSEAEVRARKQLLGAGDDQTSQRLINQSWEADQNTITSGRDQELAALRSKTGSLQYEAQEKAAKAQTEVIQHQYKSVYDTVLKYTDEFLDAAEEHTSSAWKRMADSLKKAFSSVINNFISSQFAGAISQLVTGIAPSGASGKQGGYVMPGASAAGGQMSAGAGASLLGALFGGGGGSAASGGGPVYYGGGSSGIGGGIIGQGESMYTQGLGPGGTAGTFSGPISSGGGSSTGGTTYYGGGTSSNVGAPASSASGAGGLLGGGGGIGDLLKNGLTKANIMKALPGAMIMLGGSLFMSGAFDPRNARTASGTLKTVGGGTMLGYGIGSKIPGMGGVGGGMVGMGAGLAVNGMERGSVGGTFEAMGGGALAGAGIGMYFGGPMGAAIGAGIGAAVGLTMGVVGMIMGTARGHVKDVVKRAYGIHIDDGTADAILNIAKQNFGGGVTIAVGSPQVRQLLSIYAQATGQGNGSQIYKQVSGYSAADAGGSVYNQPTTIDGMAAASYGGTVPTLAVGQMPGATGGMGGGPMLLQLNGPATTSLLSGQIASGAPQAVINGMQSQRNGNQLAASQFQPGLVIG